MGVDRSRSARDVLDGNVVHLNAVRKITNSNSLTVVFRDADYLVSSFTQAITDAILMHLHTPEVWVKEVTH